jgi:hypothetical protein
MKHIRVLIAAVAVMAFSLAFSQKAFCQDPEIDSITPAGVNDTYCYEFIITGENLLNGDLAWFSNFNDSSISCTGTPSYSDTEIDLPGCTVSSGGEDDIATFTITNGDGIFYGPDVTVSPPE